MAIIVLAAFFSACGRHSNRSSSSLITNPLSTGRTLSETLAEIDAYEPPNGVNKELFEKLRSQLREGIIKSLSGKSASFYDLKPSLYQVSDLAWNNGQSSPVRLKWSYLSPGDYNQDGTVYISDVTCGVAPNEGYLRYHWVIPQNPEEYYAVAVS